MAAVGQSQSVTWQPIGRGVGTDRARLQRQSVPTARPVVLPPRALGFRAYRPARVGSRVGTDRRGSVPTPLEPALLAHRSTTVPVPVPDDKTY